MAKHGPACTICTHDRRHQIEIGLVHKVPARVLAARFDVSKAAVQRHGRNHLSPAQRAAILAARKPTDIDLDALRANESEGLLAQLVGQRARLQQNAELAAELGDIRAAVSAESAITANLTLVGKLLGQLVQHHDVKHTSILVSPDYVRMRQTLMTALDPYPDAKRAVSSAILRLETEAAEEIAADRRDAPKVIEHQPLPPPPPC